MYVVDTVAYIVVEKTVRGVFRGSWELVAAYSWVSEPTCNLPIWPGIGYYNYKQGSQPSYKQLQSESHKPPSRPAGVCSSRAA